MNPKEISIIAAGPRWLLQSKSTKISVLRKVSILDIA